MAAAASGVERRSSSSGRWLADLVEALGSRRVRVGIDGRTASGKTTLGDELAGHLAGRGREVFRASLDDFKRPWAERHLYDRASGAGYYRNAFDLNAIRRLLLEPAAPNGSGNVALCSIDPLTQINHQSAQLAMPADAILVVDGVFAFRPELNHCWELRIWLDTDLELSVRRGTARDVSRDGPQLVETLHRDRYGALENLYAAEVDPIVVADMVIDNNDFEQPRQLRL